MVATTLIDRGPSLSESELATGDLVLRICGSPRDGQTVRVKSAKCTIGSGPRCTLRLRARGVSPLHCLIVRGSTSAVVRNWAADTRLNHQSFADAPLSPGDRLGVGPIELEVVSIGVAPMNWNPPPEEVAEAAASLQADAQRQALDEDRRRLSELEADLHQREVSLLTQAERLNGEQADFETQRQALDQQRQQCQAEQNELETQRQALDVQRQQWQAEQTELETQRQALDVQRQQCQTEQNELETQRQTLDQRRQQWQTEQTELETQRQALDQQRQQCQTEQTELETQRHAFDQQRQQWQAEQTELETQRQALDQQRQQCQAEQTELETQRHAFDQQRQQWQAEQTELETQRHAFDQQRQQWQAEQTELETQRRALDQQRQQWQTEQTELETQRQALDLQRQQVAARLKELESQQNDLAEERRRWELQRDENAAQAAAQAKQLGARLSELEAGQNALAEERRQWEAQRAELLPTTEQISASSAPVAEVEPSPEQPLPEPLFQTPPEAAPVDLAAVLRRVGAKVESVEEEHAPSRPAVRPERPSSDLRQSRAAASASDKPEGEEESIEDYMGRLMQRIRGDGGESGPASYAPPPPSGRPGHDTSVVAAEVEPKQPPQPPAAQARRPVSLEPRTVAPEKRIDLSALRELANFSAQNAISRYSRKLMINSMYGKLLVAGVALLTASALFWMWKELGGTAPMTYYAALAALLVAIYWGMQYALLSGRLTISKSGHINIDWNVSPHPNRAAPPAKTDTAAEAPAEGVDHAPRAPLEEDPSGGA